MKATGKNTSPPRTGPRHAVLDAHAAAIPLLEFDGGRAAIIEPARVIKPIDIAEHCVMCFFQEVIRELVREGAKARHVHTGQSEAGDYPVYELDYGGQRLAVVSPGVGAPAAAARMEHMIALGCRKFIACGGAGTLDSAIAVGHIVVPDSAVRDEGASYHYLKPAREVAPTPRALAAIEAVLRENHHEYIRGKTWTTDAVYRETRARMNRRRREGCVVVEMEAAAFFAPQLTGISERLARFEERLDGVDRRFESLEKEMHSLRNEMAGLRNEMESLRKEMGSQRGEMGSLRNEMESLRKEMRAEIGTLHSEIRRLDTISDLRERLAALEAKFTQQN